MQTPDNQPTEPVIGGVHCNDLVADEEAAYRHVETLVEKADAHDGICPLWHGWAIREAFVKGIEWERNRSATDQAQRRNEAKPSHEAN